MARRMPSAPTHHLARVPLFARLPAAVLDDLARSSRVRQYPPGQILCNEGDAGDHLIVLEVGHLRICRFTTIGDEAVLAAELGATRSTLNRAFHDFESIGLITLAGNRITLRKPEGLRSYTT